MAWPITIANPEPCRATIDFGRKAHVYDVRAGRYLGERQQVEATIAPAQAHLYALLLYRVKAVQVSEAPVNSVAGKHFALQIVAKGNVEPGTHVLHVEVKDANGRDRPEYSRNIKVEHGAGTFRLPLAMSDPSGQWQIKVRDVATGVVGKASFRLQPR